MARLLPAGWRSRVMWFVVLWCGGVGSVALLSFVLRQWIAPH
ncbi:DUF2474 domain-containing protein [Bradyrhizobium sp. WD16]|nr:DUF2474 domain-containing protein [Bradyrhizobium sp. WD16]UTD27403.1 DUF2474 domain-containing protein [Bradyrhizobium sp. WD16]